MVKTDALDRRMPSASGSVSRQSSNLKSDCYARPTIFRQASNERSPLVDGQSAVSTLRKWGQGAVLLLATALLAERASQYLVIVSPSFTEQLRVWPHVPPPLR